MGLTTECLRRSETQLHRNTRFPLLHEWDQTTRTPLREYLAGIAHMDVVNSMAAPMQVSPNEVIHCALAGHWGGQRAAILNFQAWCESDSLLSRMEDAGLVEAGDPKESHPWDFVSTVSTSFVLLRHTQKLCVKASRSIGTSGMRKGLA